MHDTNSYYSRPDSRWSRRTWLIAAVALTAVVALVVIMLVAANSTSTNADQPFAGSSEVTSPINAIDPP